METITTADDELKAAGFYWRSLNGVQALVCMQLEEDGFSNGFSTRLGGVSPMPVEALNLAGFNEDAAENILENRRRFLKLFPGSWLLTGCWQIHSADIRIVRSEADAQPPPDARGETVYCDALVSNTPNILVAVKTADCVPILFGDPATGSFAAVHAGWRGTLSSIAAVALSRMKEEFGTEPRNVRVAIGPAAASCCYEVGPEVIFDFSKTFAETENLFNPTREGHACINLIEANRNQLISCGVDPLRISSAPFCTMCRTDLFFSYRREKKLYGRVGRLMSVIGRNGAR